MHSDDNYEWPCNLFYNAHHLRVLSLHSNSNYVPSRVLTLLSFVGMHKRGGRVDTVILMQTHIIRMPHSSSLLKFQVHCVSFRSRRSRRPPTDIHDTIIRGGGKELSPIFIHIVLHLHRGCMPVYWCRRGIEDVIRNSQSHHRWM